MAGTQRIMQLTVKMRRPNDSVKWGFRISGGVDYSEQLKITKITPGSLAEQVGLMAGDFVTYIGDPPADATIWTHEQAQQALVRQGNEIIMTVQRGGDYAIRSPPPISSSGAGGVQTIKSQSPVPAPAPAPGPGLGVGPAPLQNYNQTPPSFVGSNANNYPSSANSNMNNMSMARPPQEIMRLTVKMRAGQGMAIDWGFRTAGGDGGPLRIISVRPESMAEDVGLQAGDMIYSVGDPATSIYNLPYHQAVQAVSNQGNNLIMTVQRGGDAIIESSGFQKAANQPSQSPGAGAAGGGGQPSVIKRTVRMERPNQNTPWGFQVFGGRDFGQSLVISKVTPGSMAQQVGLDEGDQLCFIGENPRQNVSGWTHQQAQQALINQGNKLVMTVEKKTNQNW
ncbi:uncharacterized protein LOC129598326 [Paramacrobiotus metropolitanus]|uniref:uncharacterized protein LOC129598326 n=1 Tax=Paramacrobiotus metropolitanus TaxID=2943436 RepID=UPI0024461C0C|nr:uncharacterized protein LOC129598326 [Paramacrobiotus metropolitanus]XP_055352149.1 uncharacterized protein LOC129598326 [Paramacrobiotus metropolitanus]